MNRSGSVALFDDDEKDDSDLDDLVKRNLMPYLDESSLKPEKEYVKVFLRIRPFTKTEKEKDENKGCFELENDHSVIMQAPKESQAHRSTIYGLTKQAQKFTFSKVFGENTSQKEFFDETMLSTVKDFINGENCLVFSYGVTNSGKTYTIQGDPKDAGLLPRSLDVVFNSIGSRIYGRMDLKPNMYRDVVRLSPEQEQQEIALKESIMKMTLTDDKDVCVVSDASDSLPVMSEDSLNQAERDSAIDEISTAIANRKREEATIDVKSQAHIRFSIWISFVEIYNEQVFDLLVPVSKKKFERRPALNLREDKQGNPYVKDLRQINVNSADEAYRLLALGKRNLRIACTKLNQSSSRSHCIFSIKMIRVVDREQPHYARISMLSLCDLAGSERNQKTDNSGDRVKEAGNINVSLMTLGRCIATLRANQNSKQSERQQVVPFRDSKLTRIFHAYLTGKGRASMVVNISQCASVFDETLNCLRYSAIAKQVIVRDSLPVTKPCVREARTSRVPALNPKTTLSRATVGWATPGTYQKMIEAGEISLCSDKSHSPREEDEDGGDETINEEEEEGEGHCTMTEDSLTQADDERIETLRAEWAKDRAVLVELIKQLKEKLQAEIVERVAVEDKIRAEVCEAMNEQLVIIQNNHLESLRVRDEINEDKLEKKLEIMSDAMQKSKKRRLENDGEECVPKHLLDAEISKVQKHLSQIEELEDEVDALRQELAHLKTNYSHISKERESFAQETTKAQFFASDAKQKLDDMKSKLDESSILTVDLSEQIRNLTEESESHQLSINKLTCVNGDLEVQNQLLAKELEDKEKEIMVLGTELENCKKNLADVSELTAEEETNRRLLDNEKERSADLTENLRRLQKEKDGLQKTLEEKDRAVKELETQVIDLKKESMSSRNELLITIQKLNSARDERDRLMKSDQDSTVLLGLKAELSELKEKLSTAQDKVVALESELAAVTNDNRTCRMQMDSAELRHSDLNSRISELVAELSNCKTSLLAKQEESTSVADEKDELELEKQRLIGIVSERGDQLVNLKSELSSCQNKLERAELERDLLQKEKSELLHEQSQVRKVPSELESVVQSQLDEKSQVIEGLQSELKDMKFELEKAAANQSSKDVDQLKSEVAGLVEQLSRQKKTESGYLESLQKENQLLVQKLAASEENCKELEKQQRINNSTVTELRSQLEAKDETIANLSRSLLTKKSRANSDQQTTTCLSSSDADDEADASRMEFENIINRNLQEMTNSSSNRNRLRSNRTKSKQLKSVENVPPSQELEKDDSNDSPPRRSARKTPFKKQSTGGERLSVFKSPPKSPSLGRRRRKLLSHIDEQLMTTPVEEKDLEMIAPSPHTSVIRRLRSHKP